MIGVGLYSSDFIKLKEDGELIKENITRILTTVPGERAGNIAFGSRVREYLFNFSSVLIEDIEQVILSSILKWEKRVNILGVDISIDKNIPEKMNIILDIQLKENLDEFNLNIPIVF